VRILPWRLALCGALLVFSLSGCSRTAHWQQTYEGCQRLASAMAQQPSDFVKPPDCERIRQFCSSDANSDDCKSELANYSTK
jgi:hypothetical protein